MTATISLIMTVYNRERYLGAAIESVLAQTRKDFELLVWDDGSTDSSLDIAGNYAKLDERVKVIAAPHQGRAPALKAAHAMCSGTHTGWVDSDDLRFANSTRRNCRFPGCQPNRRTRLHRLSVQIIGRFSLRRKCLYFELQSAGRRTLGRTLESCG
ncbi:MAG: glycosyltransferase [Oscillatoria sp. Prado101]|jgi:hypothetical protein|nr:glycosyltransferase [Oscillatoria sp. Prado101]